MLNDLVIRRELFPRGEGRGYFFFDEMLTGEQLYKAETPVAVAMKHVTEPLTPPREIEPGVPEGMNAVVVRLLAKDPDDRYRSADELQKDLARVRDGLEPLAADAAPTAPTAVLAPLPTGGDVETRVMSPTAAHGRAAAGAKRPVLPRVAAALLASMVLLGGAAWATSEGIPARSSAAAESSPAGTGGELADAGDASREPSGERPESSPPEGGNRASIRPAPDASREEGSGGAPGISGAVVVSVIAGETVADAERSLASAGLKVDSVSDTPSDVVPAGRIVEQGLPAGETVDPATPVNLTVDSGPEPVIARAPGSGTEPIGEAAEPAPLQQETPPAQYAPAVDPAPVQEAAPSQYASPAMPAYAEDEDDYEDEGEGDEFEVED